MRTLFMSLMIGLGVVQTGLGVNRSKLIACISQKSAGCFGLGQDYPRLWWELIPEN